MVREERVLTIHDFGLRASFARRHDSRIFSARTHSSTKAVLPETPYPNPNPTEMPLHKP